MAITISASVKFTATIMSSRVRPFGMLLRCSTFLQPFAESPTHAAHFSTLWCDFSRFHFTSATSKRMHRSTSRTEMIRFGFAACASERAFTTHPAPFRAYIPHRPRGARPSTRRGTTVVRGKFSGRDAFMTGRDDAGVIRMCKGKFPASS